MSVVTLKVLDLNRFSTGLGLIFGVTGLITTVMGPVYGKWSNIILKNKNSASSSFTLHNYVVRTR